MRIQRVVLEHHCDVAVFGLYVVHQLAVYIQLARRNLLKTGHHAKRGGFAATRRPYEYDKLFVIDLQVEVGHCFHAALIDLVDVS